MVNGVEEFDRHGRTLAHLQFDDGSSVAEALISKGLGLSITVGPNQRCAEQYGLSEQFAREARLGIWQNPGNWLRDGQKLTGRERGFTLVVSTVEKVYKVKSRPSLELKNGLRVTLNKHFFADENTTFKDLQNLLGERIEVRGWLSKMSGKQNLNLSHPTNLRVLSY